MLDAFVLGFDCEDLFKVPNGELGFQHLEVTLRSSGDMRVEVKDLEKNDHESYAPEVSLRYKIHEYMDIRIAASGRARVPWYILDPKRSPWLTTKRKSTVNVGVHKGPVLYRGEEKSHTGII